jgi:pimeloyl-ACP methyl ester carboxylesterase
LEKVRGNLAIDTMVADLVALMDALDITGKVGLAGTAVGGAIALHTAMRFPRRVAALAVSSPAVGITADRRAAVLARAERMEREGLRAVLAASPIRNTDLRPKISPRRPPVIKNTAKTTAYPKIINCTSAGLAPSPAVIDGSDVNDEEVEGRQEGICQ